METTEQTGKETGGAVSGSDRKPRTPSSGEYNIRVFFFGLAYPISEQLVAIKRRNNTNLMLSLSYEIHFSVRRVSIHE